jgi:FtsP/CotA-like multicopper oxidase with cupredoxin domain
MNRRTFLKATVAGVAALSFSRSLTGPSVADATAAGSEAAPGATALNVVRRTIEVNGKPANVFGLQQADGKPGIRLRAGENFNVLLANRTSEPTIVHWHGLAPPWPSDGVADAPLPAIAAGANRSFNFPVKRPGTYWMHAHTLQEQELLAAPLIVADPADDGRDEQEVVVLLHDFSFTAPEALLAKLRSGMPGANAMGGMNMGSDKGMTMGGGAMSGMKGMDMSGDGGMAGMGAMAMDFNDIDYDAYLANDRTLADPEVFPVEKGGRVRVRIINGATATGFTLDFGELEGRLIAVDGQDIEPIKGRRFPMTMGQRIDVRLELPAKAAGAFPIIALRQDGRERTGFILRPPAARVSKIAMVGREKGPVLDLRLESQLKAKTALADRPVSKSFVTSLVGDMADYRWGIATNPELIVDKGDRVEITIKNQSMMAHPMHLHGHQFQVVAIDGQRFSGAVRDTVLVPPGRSVTFVVDADNVGQWAYHCHHLYHMAAGMMSTFAYSA